MGFMDSNQASSSPQVWRQAGGPLVTAAAALALGLLSKLLPDLEPTAIILFAVVGSAFVGGLRAGFSSAAVAWMYYAWHFSIPGSPFHYEATNLLRIAVLAVVTPAMAALVGVLHRRGTRQVSLRLRSEERRVGKEWR